MNEALLFLEMVLTFGAVVAASRLFGKNGLIAWMAVATVLANLTTAKAVTLFGLDATLGTVMFASTFLATDILVECHGRETARTGVVIGACSAVTFIVVTQIALAYIPSGIDGASPAMAALFSLNLRISIASIVMFFLANMADVYLFDIIRKKTAGRHMWLRNNVATITCNCLENFGFVFLAFAWVFPLDALLTIAITTSVIEIIAGICDTPFLYLAKWLDGRGEIGGRWQRQNATTS